MSLTVAPETLIEAGATWTLVLNRNQNLVGKMMVVANRSVDSVTALEPDEWLDLHHQMSRAKKALDDLFHPDQGATPPLVRLLVEEDPAADFSCVPAGGLTVSPQALAVLRAYCQHLQAEAAG